MNEEKNPWDVKNIQEFSFLNCPECNFKTKTETIFQDHAVENHTKSSVLFDGDKIGDIIVDDISENSDKEKMSITELQKKGRRKIKKSSEKKVMEIDGFLDQISKDLKSCCWQNKGNQVPFQLLFDKFPIKISDLPIEVPKGNKTNKSYLVQGTNFSKSFCDDKGVFDGHRGRIRTLWCIKERKFVQANRKVFSKNNEFFFKNSSGVLQSLQEDMIVKTTGFKTRKNGFKRHLTYFHTHSQDFSWLNQIALIEYIGKDLDESSTEKPHGNSSKNKSKVYKKRDPKINEIIRSMAGMKPKDIQKYLKDMGLVEMDLTSKTVRQVLYYERLKDKKSTKTNKSDFNKDKV